MLAKLPQKTLKLPFINKLTIISLVLLMGLGLSAAYFTVPFLQTHIPAPNNMIGNTTNNTLSAPVSHTTTSIINIQTQQINATPTTNTNKGTLSTPSINTSKQNNNSSETSTTNNSKKSTTSKSTTNS